jgi:hypothetical protein
MNDHFFRQGMHVRVCRGPGTGTSGFVDFIDESGRRCLIQTDGPGRSELRWESFDSLYGHGVKPCRHSPQHDEGKDR